MATLDLNLFLLDTISKGDKILISTYSPALIYSYASMQALIVLRVYKGFEFKPLLTNSNQFESEKRKISFRLLYINPGGVRCLSLEWMQV